MSDPPARSFDAFRALVLEDAALRDRLRGAAATSEFLDLIVRLGQERGYAFDAADVREAIHAARQAWNLRWLP